MSGTILSAGADCNKNRVAWIDSLKGFAIICVVVGHVLLGYIKANTFVEVNDYLTIAKDFLYSFHMPLFFFISGYVFSLAYVGDDGNVKRHKLKWQLLNVITIYTVFSVVIILLKLLMPNFGADKASWTDLLLLYVRPFGIYWYLFILALYYVTFGFFPSPSVTKCFVFSAIFITFVDFPYFEVHRFAFNLPFFALGFGRKLQKVRWSSALVCLFVAVLLFYLMEAGIFEGVFAPILSIVLALFFCVFFVKVFTSSHFDAAPFLMLCGRRCLEIYLLHTYVIVLVRVLCGGCNVFLSVVVSAILSTALPILFAMWLERLGVHDILFRPAHWLRRIRKVRQQ